MKSSGWLRSLCQRSPRPNKGAESFMDAKDAPTVTRSRSGLSPRMCAALARPPRHGRPSMITRSCGARAASGRICRANSTFVRATGNSPISTIPGSSSAIPMPPYPWLFKGNANEPTQEGLDLLAYLESLGRARQLSGFDQQTLTASVHATTPDMAMASEPSARATPPTVPIAMTGGYSDSAPVLHPASNPDDLQEEVSRGGSLFAANCVSCHGPAGKGDGKASASLLPRPANLTAARFSDERLSSVLWNGIVGSAMPPWRQLPTEDLRALVAYIDSLHVASAPPSRQESTSLAEGKAL